MWKEVIIITALIRTFIFIIAIIASPQIGNPFSLWVQWDGPHYIDIAKNWYQHTQGKWAF